MIREEEVYIPSTWFDSVVSDLEAKDPYWSEIDRIMEDYQAFMEEGEYAASA